MNRRTMTQLDLDILYRIAMKRIAKNYSPEQLSYLIGKPDDYVGKVELLEAEMYTAEDLRCIATALGDTEVDSYYPLHTDETEVTVTMVKEQVNNTCMYICNVLKDDELAYNYFTLNDSSELMIQTTQDRDFELRLATDALLLMIQADFFYEEQMAVKVQIAIEYFLDRKVSPTAVKKAIKNFCADQDFLLKTVILEGGRFGYQQP